MEIFATMDEDIEAGTRLMKLSVVIDIERKEFPRRWKLLVKVTRTWFDLFEIGVCRVQREVSCG